MKTQLDDVDQAFEQYRAYLKTLTFIQVDPRLRKYFDLSDVIQNTLTKAFLDLDIIQALDETARKKRLLVMYTRKLLDEIRKYKKRRLDVSLDGLMAAAEASSYRLLDCFVAKHESPDKKVQRQEEALRFLEALEKLDPTQCEAITLKVYHGWKLKEIAAYQGCTTGVVAGLIARGLKKLREHVSDRG